MAGANAVNAVNAPDEDAHRQIIGIYSRHADAFDRQRSRVLFEATWLARFLAAMPHRPAVLDVGCGHGEPLAGWLITAGCALTGIDTSPELLGLCRARFPEHAWREGDMRTLHLDCRFHGLLAWDSFFHLPPHDQRGMFRVFRDHLADEGVLMFTSGPDAGVRVGEFEGEALYHASLGEAEYRSLLAEHGFEVLAHRAEDPDCTGHTVWLAKLTCQ